MTGQESVYYGKNRSTCCKTLDQYLLKIHILLLILRKTKYQSWLSSPALILYIPVPNTNILICLISYHTPQAHAQRNTSEEGEEGRNGGEGGEEEEERMTHKATS